MKSIDLLSGDVEPTNEMESKEKATENDTDRLVALLTVLNDKIDKILLAFEPKEKEEKEISDVENEEKEISDVENEEKEIEKGE